MNHLDLSEEKIDITYHLNEDVITCGYSNPFFTKDFGLQCGITNQLFEAVTCFALAYTLNPKAKFIPPKFCIDGNWGLCACEEFTQFSYMFDFNYFKQTIKELFGVDVISDEKNNLTYSFPLYGHLNLTGQYQSLDIATQMIKDRINEVPDVKTLDVLNLGYVFPRWKPEHSDIDLYSKIFLAIQPSNWMRRIIDDFKHKILTMDRTEKLIVIHVNFPADSISYLGCQRTLFKPTYVVGFLRDYLKLPRKKYSYLLIGVGFETLTHMDIETSICHREGYAVHLQDEIAPLTLTRQLHNSVSSFWLALESDLFISTVCESQFSSHILKMRNSMKKLSCTAADISKSEFSHIYPKEFIADKSHSPVMPFYYPLPNVGKMFLTKKCSSYFIQTSFK